MTRPVRNVIAKLKDISIIDALAEPSLLGQSLVGGIESWGPWLGFLRAFFGLPMDDDEAELYRACTGRQGLPEGRFRTGYLICGRGGGKSFMMALIAVYLACFRDWTAGLAPGGKPIVLLVAPTREQAKIALGYVVGILERSPVLRPLIASVTASVVELKTGVSVEIVSANYRAVRGRAVCCCLIDECAFLRQDESANPDVEIVNAIEPALGRFGEKGVLLIGSTPYARRGVLYEGFRDYHGKEDIDAVCWVSPTRTMNPTYDQKVIDKAIAKDEARGRSEYFAEFRSDIEGFLNRDAIEACVSIGVFERGPLPKFKYVGFVDPAGGSGGDAMTLAIAHQEGNVAILDVIRERKPPFSPEAVTSEFCELLKTYKLAVVTGDNYGSGLAQEPFKKRGINYVVSDRVRSELYLSALPLINSRRVDLLDHSKMLMQFMTLERRVGRSGKDSIDHSPNAGCHDDVANAVAGAIVNAISTRGPMIISDEVLRRSAQPMPRPNYATGQKMKCFF
jgi:hypothetical protein